MSPTPGSTSPSSITQLSLLSMSELSLRALASIPTRYQQRSPSTTRSLPHWHSSWLTIRLLRQPTITSPPSVTRDFPQSRQPVASFQDPRTSPTSISRDRPHLPHRAPRSASPRRSVHAPARLLSRPPTPRKLTHRPTQRPRLRTSAVETPLQVLVSG